MSATKKRKFRLNYEQRNAMRGYAFILPWLIGFLVFYAGCLFQLVRFSVMDIKIDATTAWTRLWGLTTSSPRLQPTPVSSRC